MSDLPRIGRLVVERRVNESLTVISPHGETIVVQVIQARNGRVKLCTTAPTDYLLRRSELPPQKPEDGTSPADLSSPRGLPLPASEPQPTRKAS
jgi:sRNA-binding carbon storage regulator CsrA